MNTAKPATSGALPDVRISRQLLRSRTFHAPKRPYVSFGAQGEAIVASFNRRIAAGKIEMESVPCLCRGSDFGLVASVDCFGVRQQTVMCLRCGLLQSNPRMTAKDYEDFYSSEVYRQLYTGAGYLEEYRRTRYHIKVGQHILQSVAEIKPMAPRMRILEVGAGGGWNLVPFQRAGAEVLGLDYSHSLVALGNEQGIPMQQGGLDSITGKFDVILLCHVLEHFMDPLEALRQLRGYLAEDGLIYIEVPNILNFSIGQLQMAHTYYFSPRALNTYANHCGLVSVSSGVAQRMHHFSVLKCRPDEHEDEVPPDEFAVKEIYGAIRRERIRDALRRCLDATGLRGLARKLRLLIQRGERS